MNQKIFAAFGIILCLLLTGCRGELYEEFVLDGQTMGTYYKVKYVIPQSQRDEMPMATVRAAVEFELKRVNSLMSTYDENSELSQINQSESVEPQPVSRETGEVLKLAWNVARETDGVYDPTVGPLVNLWRFGPQSRPERIPTDAEIDQARAKVGFAKVELIASEDELSVRKTIPDAYIDLSSVAKGYGVDCVARLLLKHGIDRFLIDIGGELRGAGKNLSGSPWQIGIQKPQPGAVGLLSVVSLENRAVATSGNYLNFYEENGVRYSHLIDPRTGRPISHRTASVTVLADTCSVADAWATALVVLGSEKGQAIAKKNHLNVTFVDKSDSGFMTIEVK